MDKVVFRLTDILFANLKSMALAADALHVIAPTSGDLTLDNLSSSETWLRAEVPGVPQEKYQEQGPLQPEDFPDTALSAILLEVCRLLFPTKDQSFDADVVVRTEGRCLEFCILGTMPVENVGQLIGQLEEKRRLLLQASGAGCNQES